VRYLPEKAAKTIDERAAERDDGVIHVTWGGFVE
jgi:hypothetical protein